VLVTALVQREALLRGWEAGADEYLFKPFHPRELVTRVRSLLTATRERKRAEEHYRRLLDAAPDAIVIVNGKGEIVLINTQAEQLFGWSRQELRGRPVEVLIPERFHAAHVRDRDGYLADPRPRPMGAGMELFGRRKDGREFPVEVTLSPLQTDEGVLISSSIRDVTWRKEFEERLRQAERLAAIGEMVTGLAHESRNALQQSQACLELLALRARDRPELLPLVTDIQKSQDHLHYLFEEVRGYAAPIKLRRQRTDLALLLDETWTKLAARKGRRAVLEQRRNGLDLSGEVDPLALGHVFRNVLDNALSACADPVEVRAAWGLEDLDGRPAVCVALRDNGPGLTAEVRQKLFDPFFTTKTQGTGLGMAIAKRIVEAHGGRIAVGASAGPGAEIVITLPRRCT
jgi:PAS domain S-box-containing protein